MQTEEAIRTLIREKFKDLTKEQLEMLLKALEKIMKKKAAKKGG